MKTNYTLCILWVGICLGLLEKAYAQQDFPVSSQTGDPAILVSPALIGNASESAYISLNYKSQMQNAFNGIGTKILSAGYEQTFFEKKMSLALGVYSNTLNKSALSDFSVQLAYRYTVFFGSNFFGEAAHKLSFGLEGVYRQWALSSKNLSFGSQYDPAYVGGYNPSLSPGLDFVSEKKNIFDAHFGIDYRGELSESIVLQIGASFYHLVRPKTNLLDESKRIPIRSLAYVNAVFTLAETHTLTPSIMGQLQGNAYLFQAGFNYHYNFAESSFFGAGVYYRSSDVIIPMVSLGFPHFALHFSMELYLKTSYTNMMMLGLGFPF
ncbi:MAG: hypothetical protein RR190_00335 [Bacteroidales bacterium]